jgi:hypothetical protein
LKRTSVPVPHAHTGTETEEPAELYSEAAVAAREAVHVVSAKGVHPYRVLLSNLLTRMRNTKARAQALFSGTQPDDDLDWCVLTGRLNFPQAC